MLHGTDDHTTARRHAPIDGRVVVAGAVLALAVLVAYRNSLDVPLLLDDETTLRDNPSIRELGRIGAVLFPPPEVFSAGRPLLNLSFALNYAGGGASVRGYHAINLLIHCLAGLALFGIVRRTLGSPRLAARFGRNALPLALAVAGLWSLHPLATGAVTYLSQRAESLMGLFMLLTLYGFVRACASPAPARWSLVSVGACCCGMATKEAMVTAPLLVLLYDRSFHSDSLADAIRRRRTYYACLAATWLCLGGLMLNSHPGSRGVGFGQGVGAWTYLLAEVRAMAVYVKLLWWPHPLVFDYGPDLPEAALASVLSCAALALGLLAATAVLWRRDPSKGFCGGAFFLLLAPSSSLIPIAMQPMAENRLYLPLAAVAAAGVCGIHRLAGRRMFAALALAAIGLGALTTARNGDYRSAVTLWEDTLAKAPASSRAHNNLGLALVQIRGRESEAAVHYRIALRLRPDLAEAHNNLGTVLAGMRHGLAEAIRHHEAALLIKPDYVQAHGNLANALARLPGRWSDAAAHYEAALRLEPENASLHYNYAAALADRPQLSAAALSHYRTALRLQPDFAEAQCGLGVLLTDLPGHFAEAVACLQTAVRLDPGFAEAHLNLGNALSLIPERIPEAIAHYRTASALQPGSVEVHNNLAVALFKTGRLAEAIAEFEAALRLDPSNEDAASNLQKLRALTDKRSSPIDLSLP